VPGYPQILWITRWKTSGNGPRGQQWRGGVPAWPKIRQRRKPLICEGLAAKATTDQLLLQPHFVTEGACGQDQADMAGETGSPAAAPRPAASSSPPATTRPTPAR